MRMIRLDVTCWQAPLQIEGKVDNCYLYFRSRLNAWRVTIAENEDDAILGRNGIMEREGESDYIELDVDEAVAIIRDAVLLYWGLENSFDMDIQLSPPFSRFLVVKDGE